MNGISPTPQPPQKRAGIILIGIIIVILLIPILLALNYSNIFSLSQLFPNQLGWLPHKTQPVPTPLPASTQEQNFSSNSFQYDTEKAKTILTQYIKDSIKPEFLPDNLEIKQGLSIDNRTEELNHQFGSYFTDNQTTFSINFHYKENTNTPNDFIIFIQPTNVDEATVTQAIANSLTSTYFHNPYSPIDNCETKGTTSYCENFKAEFNGKRGFGVLIGQDLSKSPPTLTSIIFTCFVPKESKDYNTQKSCISL